MAEPRWLTEREQRTWRRFIAATGMLGCALERQLQRDSGMPHAYYEILVALSEAPNRTLRMSDLAQRTRSSRSRLSHAVTRMERSGWVDRMVCPSDKRGAFAVLTASGFEVLEAAAPPHVEAVRRLLFDVLTPAQVDQLGEICARISDPLSADEET